MIYKPFTNNSTSLIIEDIKECLKEDLPSQITIDTADLSHLIGEIETLKEIIRQLDIKKLELTTIIKEVREYIKEMQVYCIEFESWGVPSKELLEILDKVGD